MRVLRGGYFTLGVKGGSSREEMSYNDAMTYITKEGGDIKKIRNMKRGDTYTFKTRSGKTGYVTKEFDSWGNFPLIFFLFDLAETQVLNIFDFNVCLWKRERRWFFSQLGFCLQ